MKLRPRRAVLALAAIAAGALSTLTTTPASAAPTPAAANPSGLQFESLAQAAKSGDTIVLPGAAATDATVLNHTCAVIGTVGGRRGVHCADVAYINVTDSAGDRGYEICGHGESLCDTGGGTATYACTAIDQHLGLYSATPLVGRDSVCGAFGGGGCPSGRFGKATPHIQVFLAQGLCTQVFAALTDETIELTSSAGVSGVDVASEPHTTFCGM